jgi:catechol 2,3-dioxygenase-like lactoylglutathione lyase family enzyme
VGQRRRATKASDGVELRGLHHVAVSVSDLDRSLQFYVDLLGLEVAARGALRGSGITRLLHLPDDHEARQAFVKGSSSLGQIELIEWRPASLPAPRAIPALGLSLISFGLSPEGFDVMLRRCRDNAVEIVGGPEVLDVPDYPPTKLFIVVDPDRNPVEFMARAEPHDLRRD